MRSHGSLHGRTVDVSFVIPFFYPFHKLSYLRNQVTLFPDQDFFTIHLYTVITMSGIAPTYDQVTGDVDPSTMGNTTTGYTQGGSGHMTGQAPITDGYETSNYDSTGNNNLQSR